MTRSPGVQPLTPSPRAAISPANSVPARAGLTGAVATRNCAPRISSPRFVPAARTATTTWPSPGAGTGLARNSNTAPSGPGTVNHAFIVCVIAETLLGQAFGRSAASNINDTVAAFTSPQSESSSSGEGSSRSTNARFASVLVRRSASSAPGTRALAVLVSKKPLIWIIAGRTRSRMPRAAVDAAASPPVSGRPGPATGPGRGRRTLRPARAWRRCERYRRLGNGGEDAGRRALRFRLLAVEVERSHHRRVGEAEQEGGAIAAVDVLMEGPGRHREHVLVLPVQPLAAHHRVSGALYHVVIRAADVAMGLGRLPRAQQLDVARNGRHDGSAGHSVRVFEDDAVEGVAGVLSRQPFQGGTSLGHRVVPPRRADALADGLRLPMVLLVEPGLQHTHQRGVQAIEPDHRLIGVVRMVVPRPIGGQHEVTRVHGNAVTVYDRVAALALDDQAQRRGRMAMGAGDLAGHHDLEIGHQRVARRHARQLGVGQAKHPSFGLLGPDELGCPHRLGTQIAPTPYVWHGLAPGLDADAAADPGRRHVLRSELRVVVPQFLGRRLDVGEFQHWASSSHLALSRTERGLRRRNRCRGELIQLHSGFDLLVPTPGAHVHHEPIRALVLSVDLVAARALGAMCRLERGTRLREVIDVEADVVDALDGGRPFAEVGCVVAAVLEDGKIDVTIAQPHALGSGVGGLAT